MNSVLSRISLLAVLILSLCYSHTTRAQGTLTNPYTVTTFPTTISNINTGNGESATGMQGACFTLPCCSVEVFKVTIPTDGVIRVEMTNFTPLAGSIIAYRSLVSSPTAYSDLEYIASSPGNFCGFRDTLQLGRAYGGWDNTPLGGTPTLTGLTSVYDFNNPSFNNGFFPAGDYYLLVFNENQQTSQGLGGNTGLTFEYLPGCLPLTAPGSLEFDTLEVNAGSDTVSFYVKNDRTLPVTIDVDSGISITGADSAMFTVLTNPDSNLAIGDSTLMELVFSPTSGGLRSATLSFDFADSSCSSTMDIPLTGTGAEPEIALSGNGSNITNNDLTPSSTNHTDFGSTVANAGTITRTFTITNDGSDTLDLTGNPIVSLTGSSAFVVTAQPGNTALLPGASTTFTVTYTPTAVGTDTADLTIANTDADEGTFVFRMLGLGAGQNGLDFDGSGDYVTINGVAAGMAGSSTFTLETWIKVDGNQSGNDRIWGVNTSSNGTRFLVTLDDGILEFFDNSNTDVLSSYNFKDDTWHHIALSFDNGTLRTLIDGVFVSEVTSNTPSLSSTDKWSLGQEFDGGSSASDFLNATLNEVRIWNTARTDQEIKDGRYCEIQNPDSSLIGYYTFNQGLPAGDNSSITTLLDGSGNGNDGTLFGFTKTGTSSNFLLATEVGLNCTSVQVTVCDAPIYNSPGGNVYDSTAVYNDTLTNGSGGDSVLVTDLLINYTEYAVDSLTDTTVCDSVTFGPVATPLSSSLNFVDANSDWVEMDEVADSLVNTNRSIFLWMRAPDQVSSSSDVMVGIQTSGTSTVTNFGIATNEQLWIYDGGNNRNSGVVVTDGLWHFVGYTYDEASNFTQFWVDGVAANSFTNGQSISATSRISLGQEWDGSSLSQHYNGQMAEVSFWKEVLDSTDIAAIMQAAIDSTHPQYNNLIAYYPGNALCSDDGFTLRDFSGNGLDGVTSARSIINTDSLVALPGFNAAAHYDKAWSVNGSVVSTADSLEINGGVTAGNYDLQLQRDFFGINDSWTVSLQTGCSSTPLTAQAVIDSNASCNGFFDGGATASASGGTTPYTFVWSNGGTTASITGVPGGTYSVTVTDANGDTDSTSVTINQPPAVAAFAVIDSNASCSGFLDGGATASASGGTSPYTYQWSNSAITASITGVAAGTYSVTITDNNGCTDSASVSISQPPALVAGIVLDSNATGGAANGGATASASGGTAPYSYTWSNAATTASITGVVAGTYSVTVTDNNGCTDSTSLVIQDLNLISVTVSIDANVSCNGASDGQASASTSNGTSPYTYNWSNTGTGPLQVGLPAGTYTVTVTDANGDTAVDAASITQPTLLMASSTVNADASCNGAADGSITTTANGGTTPYTYTWSHGDTNAIITGLTAGAYTVTITDANGCSTTSSASITEPTAVTVTNAIIKPDCGNSNGDVNITVSGGTGPYAYAWSNGFTAEDLSSIAGGTYTVTITDNTGCTGQFNFNVSNAGTLDGSSVITGTTCPGDANGSIDFTPTGGATPYSYTWSTGDTTQDLTGLTAGLYTVTLTDSIGCLFVATDTVIEPDTIGFAYAITNVGCPGGSDGAIDLTVSGGTAPYTYAWSNSATTEDLAALTEGTYSITVTDANGCTGTSFTAVGTANPLDASVATTSSSDFTTADGAAAATTTGGTTPYTYLWSNGSTMATLTGLLTNAYVVTVTDANGCTDEAYGYVPFPASSCQTTLDWEAIGADEALFLPEYDVNGITVNLTGFENGGVDGEDNFSLEHGERGGISNIGHIQFEMDPTSNNDSSENNRLTIDFSDPVRNLEFVLTDVDASGSYADSMRVAAYDANGNSLTGYFNFIGDEVAVTYGSDTLEAVGLDGSSNSQDLGNVGVIFPDTVSRLVVWQYTGRAGNSDPGDHRFYVSGLTFENDYQGVYDDYVSVIENDSVDVAVLDNDDLTCHDPQSATILTQPLNGSAIVTGSNDIRYQPAQKFFGIDSLQYQVCDTNGLCDSAWVFVSVLPQYIDSLSWAANNADESVAVDSMFVYRNRVDFTFSDSANIDDGGLFTIESSSLRGQYAPASYLEFDINAASVSAADEFVEVEMDFEEPVKALHFQLIDVDNSGSGGGVDSVVVEAFGPNGQSTPVYFYDMGSYTTSFRDGDARIFYGINESSSSSESFANVGVYIPDSVQSIVVTYDPPVTADGDGNPAGQSSWLANLYWRQALPEMAVSNAGTTIADQDTTPSTADSTDFGSVFLGDSLAVTYTISNTGSDTLFVTNPVSLTGTGAADFSVVGAPSDTVLPGNSTDLIVQFTPSSAGLKEATLDITSNDVCNPGYGFAIRGNASCPSYTASALVDSNASCNSFADGGATASVVGGTAPFTYTWSNSATTASITGVMAGTYSVTITDVFGCFDSTSVTITEPAALIAASVVDSNISCNSFTDGGATASATGGTGIYTYLWSNSATTASITGVATGTYSVTVTDANGCTDSTSVTITEPAALVAASIVDSNVSCNGFLDGGATASASGGTMPYSYAWSNSAVTASITGVAAGTYSVTITDANGCSDSTSVTITEPAVLIAASIVDSNVTCNGFLDGGATASATGGTAPYSYSWSISATTASITGVAAGTYSVTITDANGCTDSTSVSISEPAALVSATVVDSNVSCNSFTDGGATASATGGTMPYTYLWSNSATTASITGVVAGTYSVTLTDANGCTDSTTVTITEPAVLTVNITVDSNESCTGQADGGMTAQVSGGTMPYTYAWSNSATSAANIGLAAGTYSVVITDANGCTAFALDSIILSDVTVPTVITQNLTIYLDANGQATITANDVDNGSFDACGLASLVLDSTAFDCSEVGANTVTLMVTDVNGNAASDTAVVTVLDTLAPTVVKQNLTVYLDANGQASITAAAIDNGSSDNCSIASSTLDSTNFDCSETGANTVTLTVTDVNGNSASDTATVTVLDTIAPVAQAQNLTLYLDASGLVSTTAAAADNGSSDNCSISSLVLSQSNFDCNDVGTNSVILIATDASNNMDSTTFTVTVFDTLIPTAQAQNLTLYLDANGTASTTALAVDNGSFDNCGLSNLALDSTNFDCSEVGANTVTLTVTDVNNNVDSTTATITVLDTLVPTVITQNVTVYLDANGQASITANDIDNGSFDNCTIDTITLDSTAFDCGEVGANTVVLTVTDVNGNSDTASATVTVLDTIAPTVLTQNVTIYLDSTGQASIFTGDIDNGSFDNCGIDSTVLDSTHFDCSETGVNTVTLTITDVNGNTASATATVTVLDTIAPTLTVANDTAVCPDDSTGTVVSWSTPIFGDNCVGATLAQTAGLPSGSLYPVGITTNVFAVTDSSGNVTTDSFTVEVHPFPILSIDPIGSLCETGSAITLVGLPAGGTFSGNGVTGNSFDPTAVAPGNNAITYTFTTTEGCTYSTVAFAEVRENPVVVLGSFADSICIEQEVVACPVATPSGGIYSGSGIDDILFRANQAGLGQHVITYTFTDVYGCTGSDSTIANVVQCFTPVGLDELPAEEIEVSVYPNPNNGTFTVEHNITGKAEARIIASDGSLVKHIPVLEQRQQITVETLSQGVFFLQVITENAAEIKRIVIQ